MFPWKKICCALMLVNVLALAGCNTQQPTVIIPTAAPTQDLSVVRTEAAQTVVAQITTDAQNNPTAAPTATLEPSATATAQDTATPAPAQPTLTPATPATATRVVGTRYPTATITPYTDAAQFVTQNLRFGQVMEPGEDFDAKWTVKNIGVRDWTNEFYYKYVSGNLKPKNDMYMIGKIVQKGDSVQLLADFLAPHEPGNYTSNWVIINDDGTAFFRMSVVIVVR